MKTIRIVVAALSLSLCSLAVNAQSTSPALTAYYSVKDALVATDAAKARMGATALLSALDKVDAAMLSTSDKKVLTMAKTQTAAMSKTTDVEMQREQFETLSSSMITLTKATKPGKLKVNSGRSAGAVPAPTYVQFCPMAADGKGASWLSDRREIQNPYYGNKMLKCGSVKEEI